MNGSPILSVPICTITVAVGPRPGFDLRFDDGAARRRGRRSFQFHHFGLQRHHLEQVDRCRCPWSPRPAQTIVSPPQSSGVSSLLLKLLLDPIDVRAGQIDLVDRDHDLHVRRGFGVIDRFDRLRHEAVIRRDHEHDDVGHVGAARAHGGEGGVARRVEKVISWPL